MLGPSSSQRTLLFLWPSSPKTKSSTLLDLLGIGDGIGPWNLCFYQLEPLAKGCSLHLEAALGVLKLWPP